MLHGDVLVAIPSAKMNLGFSHRWDATLMPTLQCLCIAYLIGSTVTVRSGIIYRILNLEPIQWVGKLSYSLYIWQQLVLVPAQIQIFPETWPFLVWIVRFPQNIVAAFILALLSFYCLEQPVLRFKSRFVRSASGLEPRNS
jgi:peptidoglycan/LPS O-acetylase OafA/YrhL